MHEILAMKPAPPVIRTLCIRISGADWVVGRIRAVNSAPKAYRGAAYASPASNPYAFAMTSDNCS